MFGLMKARTCSATPEVKRRRRMHYCGACKTIGRLYGQKARLLLNHDTVFLAELLTALSGEDQELDGWAGQYRSYNCMSLPRTSADMPLALQLAAAGTMVMAEFKVADHISDRQGRQWKLARRVYRDGFARAAAHLEQWKFPIGELRQCWEAQVDVETRGPEQSGLGQDEVLLQYAGPTAKATSLFFEYGARIASDGSAAERMKEIGQRFGELVYLLDGLEDYEEDARSGGFNPLRVAFAPADGRLDGQDREKTIGLLRQIASQIESGIETLPIPEEQARMFTSRLRANLSGRIGIKLPVIAQAGRTCGPHRPRLTLRERLREAMMMGQSLTTRHLEERCGSLVSYITAPFLFSYAAALAIAFPEEMRSLGSVRESFGMPFNMILVGGLVRSWPRIILKPIPPSGPKVGGGPEQPVAGDVAEEAQRHAELAAEATKKKGGCGCCDCDCCSDCDCCCDCAECGDCCSGCDC
jgi:hypothetical protein